MDYGFDNTVMNVNHDWVFRFPRREIAVRLLETEGKLLPLLEESGAGLHISGSGLLRQAFLSVQVAISRISLCGRDHPVSGSLCRERRESLPLHWPGSLKSFTEQCGGSRKTGVPYDELSRVDVEKRHPILEKNKDEIKDLNLFHQMDKLETYLHNLPRKALPEETTLVHGDLHFKNIVVDHEGILSGILDWGDVHLGHRAIDLNLITAFSPLRKGSNF